MFIAVSLYIVLNLAALFAPLRWAIAAYLISACVDFPGNRDSVGLLNAFHGFAVPIYLLWRLRAQAGHRQIIVAPVAWGFLIVYAGLASFWSFFPTAALKLVGHMAGTLIIAFVFVRAAKGGYLTSRVVVPVAIGSMLLAIFQLFCLHNWSGEPTRFNALTPAQGFAAFIAALYCVALSAPFLRSKTRLLLCLALATSLLFNGSRIWFVGILLATLLAFVLSGARAWMKILSLGFLTLLACSLFIVRAQLTQMISNVAPSNRIVAAALKAYEGDLHSDALGTFRFRRDIDKVAIQRLQSSTATEFLFGRGTSNGALITGSMFHGYSGMVDPNRMVHNEWVRVFYEWGLVGFLLWCAFWASIIAYAVRGVRTGRVGYAKPLLVYLPSLLVALAGENFIAGAGSAMSMGLLMLLGFATLAYRYPKSGIEPLLSDSSFYGPVHAPELVGRATG